MDSTDLSEIKEVLDELTDFLEADPDLDPEEVVDLYGELAALAKRMQRIGSVLRPRLESDVEGSGYRSRSVRRIFRTYNFAALMTIANRNGMTFQDLWLDGYLRIVMTKKGFDGFLDAVGLPHAAALAREPLTGSEPIAAGPAHAQFVSAEPSDGLVWEEPTEPTVRVSPITSTRRAVSPPPQESKGRVDDEDDDDTEDLEEQSRQEAIDNELRLHSEDMADESESFARSNSDGWFYDD